VVEKKEKEHFIWGGGAHCIANKISKRRWAISTHRKRRRLHGSRQIAAKFCQMAGRDKGRRDIFPTEKGALAERFQSQDAKTEDAPFHFFEGRGGRTSTFTTKKGGATWIIYSWVERLDLTGGGGEQLDCFSPEGRKKKGEPFLSHIDSRGENIPSHSLLQSAAQMRRGGEVLDARQEEKKGGKEGGADRFFFKIIRKTVFIATESAEGGCKLFFIGGGKRGRTS